jgi:hypothetical protein
MKWFKLFLGIMFLATVMTVPVGCGKGQITEMKKSGEAAPTMPGHEAAVKNMNKKPADVKPTDAKDNK